jgi:hypothetical protein
VCVLETVSVGLITKATACGMIPPVSENSPYRHPTPNDVAKSVSLPRGGGKMNHSVVCLPDFPNWLAFSQSKFVHKASSGVRTDG